MVKVMVTVDRWRRSKQSFQAARSIEGVSEQLDDLQVPPTGNLSRLCWQVFLISSIHALELMVSGKPIRS
jgi:hypothetical protein